MRACVHRSLPGVSLKEEEAEQHSEAQNCFSSLITGYYYSQPLFRTIFTDRSYPTTLQLMGASSELPGDPSLSPQSLFEVVQEKDIISVLMTSWNKSIYIHTYCCCSGCD